MAAVVAGIDLESVTTDEEEEEEEVAAERYLPPLHQVQTSIEKRSRIIRTLTLTLPQLPTTTDLTLEEAEEEGEEVQGTITVAAVENERNAVFFDEYMYTGIYMCVYTLMIDENV